MKGKIDIQMDPEGSGYAVLNGDNHGAQILDCWLGSENPRHDDEGVEFQTHAREKRPFVFHGMGNNWGCYQFEDHVFVRSETDREEELQVLLTAEHAANLLKAYEAFFEGDREPTTVEVEFIATGGEAKVKFLELAGNPDIGPPIVIQWLDEEKAAEAAAKGGA